MLFNKKNDPLFSQLMSTYNRYWTAAHFFGESFAKKYFGEKVQKVEDKLYGHLKEQKKKGSPLKFPEIETCDPQTFKKEFLVKNQPFVLKGGAKNWPCLEHWKPSELKKKYGKDEITLIDASPDDLNDIDYSTKSVSFSDVLDDMSQENPQYYSRFNRMLHEHPELIDDLDYKYLLSLRPKLSSGKTFQCFLGGARTITHLHAAAEHNLFVQVHGKKRWIVFPPEYNCLLKPVLSRSPYFHSAFNPLKPDFQKYPLLEFVDYYDFEIEAGDIFFNPPCWWHHVINPTMSIGVGFRWFEAITSIKASGMQTLLTLCAVNPNIIQATRDRANFPKIFSYLENKKKS